ncbi:MAG TPA: response regulator [Candidatus Acidoferrales bacterium]|nr:response regulator [Candidatus Acidoferrales bacterium]
MNALDPHGTDSAPTILVVDDNKGVLDFLLLLLSKHQLTGIGASSGAQCLEIVQNRRIDLIILDVMMPVMDGLEVCQQLKKIAPSIPVILLTARDDMMTRAAAMDLGVSEFVAKPVNNRDLLNRVRTQLRSLELGKANDQAFAEIEKTATTPGHKS